MLLYKKHLFKEELTAFLEQYKQNKKFFNINKENISKNQF